MMTDRGASTTSLRAAVAGIRAFVLDADGVIFLKGEALPGAIEALATLDARGIPYRVVTNYSLAHRETLAAQLGRRHRVTFDPERIITAASASASYTADRYRDRPIVVVGAADSLREFEGQAVVPLGDAVPGDVGAVVIGDAGDDLTFGQLDAVFRLLRGGADFLAMHRNPWWLTPRGPTLDAGALVTGLEFATGRKATVLGKPSATVFRQALAGLRHDLGRRIPASAAAMVGDDPIADVRAGQRVGLRGILVLTGKTDAAAVDALRGRRPDGVAPSLADVVAALGRADRV